MTVLIYTRRTWVRRRVPVCQFGNILFWGVFCRKNNDDNIGWDSIVLLNLLYRPSLTGSKINFIFDKNDCF